MRTLVYRAVIAALAVAAWLVPATVASAAPILAWSPQTTAGTYIYDTVTAGQSSSVEFTLTNSGDVARGLKMQGPKHARFGGTHE